MAKEKVWMTEAMIDAGVLEKTLNQYQRNGWEIFQVIRTGSTLGVGEYRIIVYKEQKEQTENQEKENENIERRKFRNES